jgi:hypothetical protein
MKTICYDCTRTFDRENLVPLEDLFCFIPGEPDPVGLCPRCGGLCLPEAVPVPSVAMESILPSTPAAAALVSLNFMLSKSLP